MKYISTHPNEFISYWKQLIINACKQFSQLNWSSFPLCMLLFVRNLSKLTIHIIDCLLVLVIQINKEIFCLSILEDRGLTGFYYLPLATDYGHPMKAQIKDIWKIGPMWQTKYASAIPKNLGLGLNFRPCCEGYFLSGRP